MASPRSLLTPSLSLRSTGTSSRAYVLSGRDDSLAGGGDDIRGLFSRVTDLRVVVRGGDTVRRAVLPDGEGMGLTTGVRGASVR